MMLIDEQAKWIKSQQDENTYSLNYENFINERKNRIEETSKYNKLDEFKSPFKLKTLKVDLPGLEKDTDLKESRLRWEKDLSKDIYLYEAVNVLEDLSHPIQKINKLAQIKK